MGLRSPFAEQKQKRVVLMRLLEEGRVAAAAGHTKPLTTALFATSPNAVENAPRNAHRRA